MNDDTFDRDDMEADLAADHKRIMQRLEREKQANIGDALDKSD